MSMSALMIANRGEIAIRIATAARDLGLRTATVHPQDDADSLHVRRADAAVTLPGQGPAAYLDVAAVIAAAKEAGCDAVHPGYGFLAERADFAAACADAGLVFVGPTPAQLDLFGDKARARQAAVAAGAPVNAGIDRPVTLEEARAFLADLGPGGAMMIKAVGGGGGRGSRAVLSEAEVEEAYARCTSEARLAFGRPELYVEAFIPRARHVEVQIVGDRHGAVAHLGERECSIQRRYQKIVEIAPAPGLDPGLREEILDAALRIARSVDYLNLGTFEFLVDATGRPGALPFVFIEANARLQVEHTVTEAVTGVDLVQTQLKVADGASLAELGLDDPAAAVPRGWAVQTRVNLETIGADGAVRPGGGLIETYEPPTGPGIRVDGFGYRGYRTSGLYDSLLAKVIAHAPAGGFEAAARRAERALAEFRLEGVRANKGLLRAILAHPDVLAGRAHTRWVDEEIAGLAAAALEQEAAEAAPEAAAPAAGDGYAGARIDREDPLALFAHDAAAKAAGAAAVDAGPPTKDGAVGLVAPMQGTIVTIDVEPGEAVWAGRQVALVEAMKMEHVIVADRSGIVREVTMKPGDVVREGWPIVYLEEAEVEAGAAADAAEEIDLDHIRADLQEAIDRHAYTLDENRPEAVAKRRARGFRMLRESIDELFDEGSFSEYWPLIVAHRHSRHDMETLRRTTPADGVVAGTGSINGDKFSDDRSRAIVVAYDYTVLAGTQGRKNHYKQDRMFELAHRFRLPVVLFSEGGGGRPGDDVDGPRVALDVTTFTTFSSLSGLVPMVGVNNGRCFAGNTALLACCDVIIATEASTIAMGGPAMIEGGGLGIYTPEEVGPMSFQVPNGVVDILVKDEAEAVAVAKKYLSYFQGPIDEWTAPDQRRLRHVVPEKRTRLYEMRDVINLIADEGSVLEIREKFGIGIITALIRVEGRPMGVIANNPHHLSGAVDSDGSDKGARFLQLCDAFDIPVISLVDCPGIMVGPDHERTALVRHCARLFNVGANMTTPLFTIIVRKAYGLGAQAMCGAGTLVGFMTVAWPTAEFAGMNIEGSVKLGFRNELAAMTDPAERKAEFDRRVAEAYETARAVNAVVGGGVDDVIDPAATRAWIVNGLRRLPPVPPRTEKKHRYIDTW
ncbi:carboxyl transferase domain-containing protein [Albimonas sp. CAU 1670]|uniref:acetyl-CoA carboxylase family protein n=1 Tax=Albimonas sp. CAU 1670 TaxID=3032599 RepID=UPI0023DB23D7|nr:carboxyl transferase domain-containing protein [Albimonas sp. CAU 1670]MDF2233359.1 carboxyl transferase domain-containing protein [Albimonas sp. CAU 1670]